MDEHQRRPAWERQKRCQYRKRRENVWTVARRPPVFSSPALWYRMLYPFQFQNLAGRPVDGSASVIVAAASCMERVHRCPRDRHAAREGFWTDACVAARRTGGVTPVNPLTVVAHSTDRRIADRILPALRGERRLELHKPLTNSVTLVPHKTHDTKLGTI
eukprot:974443-Rhodomonas_salina.2